MRSYDKDLSMKLKNLFENNSFSKEKNLIGMKINGKIVDENTSKTKWIGDFDGFGTQLTSLEGAPSEVSGDFLCNNNKLTSLEGAPSRIGGSFFCGNNKLTSLEGAPSQVGGYFNCGNNKLTSLEGAPSQVSGSFLCDNNKLTSLEGAPSQVGGYFSCDTNDLTSLHNIHKIIKKMNGYFSLEINPIKSHVLGLMLIPGITEVNLDDKEVETILNNGIKNKKHWTEVQAELEEAGFEEYAQL